MVLEFAKIYKTKSGSETQIERHKNSDHMGNSYKSNINMNFQKIILEALTWMKSWDKSGFPKISYFFHSSLR